MFKGKAMKDNHFVQEKMYEILTVAMYSLAFSVEIKNEYLQNQFEMETTDC